MKTGTKANLMVFVVFAMMLTIKISANAMMLVKSTAPVIVINNEEVNFPDAEPFTDSQSRVQVPVRPVCEALGAELNWDEETQTVTVTKDDTTVKLVIGSDTISINGEEKTMDTAAVIHEGRTYVPVRFLSEAFGATVEWVEPFNLIVVMFDKQPTSVSVKKFEANYRVLLSASMMYIAEYGGEPPQSFDDLAPYISDIDILLNSPKGAEYVLTVDSDGVTLTAAYEGTIFVFEY